MIMRVGLYEKSMRQADETSKWKVWRVLGMLRISGMQFYDEYIEINFWTKSPKVISIRRTRRWLRF